MFELVEQYMRYGNRMVHKPLLYMRDPPAADYLVKYLCVSVRTYCACGLRPRSNQRKVGAGNGQDTVGYHDININMQIALSGRVIVRPQDLTLSDLLSQTQ